MQKLGLNVADSLTLHVIFDRELTPKILASDRNPIAIKTRRQNADLDESNRFALEFLENTQYWRYYNALRKQIFIYEILRAEQGTSFKTPYGILDAL